METEQLGLGWLVSVAANPFVSESVAKTVGICCFFNGNELVSVFVSVRFPFSALGRETRNEALRAWESSLNWGAKIPTIIAPTIMAETIQK